MFLKSRYFRPCVQLTDVTDVWITPIKYLQTKSTCYLFSHFFFFQFIDSNSIIKINLYLQFNIEFLSTSKCEFECKTTKKKKVTQPKIYFYTFDLIRQIEKAISFEMFTKIYALSKNGLRSSNENVHAWKRQLLLPPFRIGNVNGIRCTTVRSLLCYFVCLFVFYAFDTIWYDSRPHYTHMFTWLSTWIEMHTLHAAHTERSDQR